LIFFYIVIVPGENTGKQCVATNFIALIYNENT